KDQVAGRLRARHMAADAIRGARAVLPADCLVAAGALCRIVVGFGDGVAMGIVTGQASELPALLVAGARNQADGCIPHGQGVVQLGSGRVTYRKAMALAAESNLAS